MCYMVKVEKQGIMTGYETGVTVSLTRAVGLGNVTPHITLVDRLSTD